MNITGYFGVFRVIQGSFIEKIAYISCSICQMVRVRVRVRLGLGLMYLKKIHLCSCYADLRNFCTGRTEGPRALKFGQDVQLSHMSSQ